MKIELFRMIENNTSMCKTKDFIRELSNFLEENNNEKISDRVKKGKK